MIINMDDLNYILICEQLYVTHREFSKIKTLESVLEWEDCDWLFYLFSIYHLESRCLETESYLNTHSSYRLSSYFYPNTEWAEMEERIRRDYYGDWYESRTGMKI